MEFSKLCNVSKNGCIILIVLVANAFSAGWYARGKGYEKCMNTEDGFLVCRENFVNDFCYGKERMWTNHGRGRVWYHTGEEREWFDRKLMSVRNLNHKCEYHGWARFRVAEDKWVWQCYLNNRTMQDADCKGFRKR